jgi:nucleoside-diphosphate-sugar epimerase
MRVLIIGGTGVSGYWLVEELLERGHQVTIFHRGQQEAQFSRPIAHIHGDRQQQEAFAAATSGLALDAVVHMAALGHQRGMAGQL